MIPVARNVWQHVVAGSPAATARRLIIASTARRPSGRPLRPPRPVHALEERRPRVLEAAGGAVRLDRLLGPVVRRHVVPLPALLVQPQPPPRSTTRPSLARLSADELCAKLEPGLKEFGDAGMLSGRVRQLLDSEADGGAREIAVALVGVGVTAGLERMQEFPGRFKMSIDVVSFEVFELAGGPRLLIREVTEEHADAPVPAAPRA